MKLKEVHRTSTFAWSPAAHLPQLATGTVAGALDASFSDESRLEIWTPNFLDRSEYDLGSDGHTSPSASVSVDARFNRLAWGGAEAPHPHGLLAAGMESGEVALWDPTKILANDDPSDSLIMKNKSHDGPVRGLDFNPVAKNLLASGATNGQIWIWDLKDPSTPYTPGGRSTRLDEITALSWNNVAQQILASASSTGYTVVWDLRGKREVVALTYSGTSGPMQTSRRGQSAVAWHPDNSTRLVTASEDDVSPVIMLWDLRNARAPENILNGHDKGILSLSWCKQDANLLLSCGKDQRTLAWNPDTAEILGEVPAASNWAFQVEWCPRNPDLLAVASFDGSIGIHSLQSTQGVAPEPQIASSSDDIFNPSYHQNFESSLCLKHPPKWLHRPVSATFGYGGTLITVNNLLGASGQNQSSSVHIHKVVTENNIVLQAKKLENASGDAVALASLAKANSESRSADKDTAATWSALASLFDTSSKDGLIALLGFSKDQIVEQVEEAVKALQAQSRAQVLLETGSSGSYRASSAAFNALEATTTPEVATTESSSLFGDDVTGTPAAGDASADFFSSLGPIPSAIPDHLRLPHVDPSTESSVAATQGSPFSSVAPSEVFKSHTFKIYPDGESNTDHLITKALVLGDFDSAVTLCLSAERFSDAILLAAKGGPELLKKTQAAYFERRTISLPYLRLFQSIVGNDLADIVQNADLKEWQVVFVILCTYASSDEFAALVEQLGLRLEFQGNLVKTSGVDDAESKARNLRKHATLCYLAAGRLEKVVNIWVEEMVEEEEAAGADAKGASRYTVHAEALQNFIEKVTIFRAAVKYVDTEMEQPTTSEVVARTGARTYKLASLYDRYFEYADLLATQGLVDLAVQYLALTPKDYKGADDKQDVFDIGRERLLVAAGQEVPAQRSIAAASIAAPAIPSKSASRLPLAPSYGYGVPPTNPHTGPTPYAPLAGAPTSAPYMNGYGGGTGSGYAPYQSQYGRTLGPNVPPAPMVPPPAGFFNTGYTPPTSSVPTPSNTSAPLPAAQRKDISGWNDAPIVVDRKPLAPTTRSAISTPYPNAPPAPGVPSYMQQAQHTPSGVPPPPRAGSAAGHSVPHPPRAGTLPPAARGMGSSPPPAGIPPPPKAGSHPLPPAALLPQPPNVNYGPRPGSAGPPQSQYGARPPSAAPPPATGTYALRPGSVGPPGGGLPPPPAAAASPYAPPPLNVATSPYAPPQAGAQPGPYAPPPSGGMGLSTPPPPAHRAPPPPRAAGAPTVRAAPPPAASGGSPYAPLPEATSTSPTPVHAAPPAQATPPPKPAGPKYPPGDRSHIPDSVKPIYQLFTDELNKLKATGAKRLAEDTERRLNILFDSLNCATLSMPVVEQLFGLYQAFQERNPQLALQIHLDMLTKGARGGDDITVWMPGVKQLINRMLA